MKKLYTLFVGFIAMFCISSVSASELKGHYYSVASNGKFMMSGFIEDETSDRVKIKIDKVSSGFLGTQSCIEVGNRQNCIGDSTWAPKGNGAATGITVTIE